MDHIAIMKKSWGLLEKISSGEKTIESRWYMNRSAPWDKIEADDMVYFKNSGEKITLKSSVDRVMQFENLTVSKVRAILSDFGEKDGITKNDFEYYFNRFKEKRYCILVFLKLIERVKPFEIDKSGFGSMSAWISINDVNRISSTPVISYSSLSQHYS